ncbi:MAG TPA: carboxypeptidase-like regulatory domain-containing protein, partial [Chitinophagaceae bacterium]|nr:carboxypeptidase-like regulatory domain-containing protein [Chitinophagaceae bacterium]
MKSYFLFSVIILSSLLLNARDNYLTQTIKGTVIDEQSGHVLSDVTVMVDAINPVIASITDAAGNFKLYKIPVGRQTIKVSFTGYEEAVVQNIEVTSTKEVILEIKLKERIKKLEEVVVTANKQKNRALNEAAIVSARQFSVDEAVRYAGTRNDPSRMAQNFAGVSGTNDARNDIVIRGNSPS